MGKQVTSLEEIRRQVQGEVITIPGWVEGTEVNVRVRPVDLTAHLLTAGPLPNSLVRKVREAFEGETPPGSSLPAPEDLVGLLPVFDAVARGALAEPTYEQITEVAPLTFEQKAAIFAHVTRGLQQAESFRRQAGSDGPAARHSKNVGNKAK